MSTRDCVTSTTAITMPIARTSATPTATASLGRGRRGTSVSARWTRDVDLLPFLTEDMPVDQEAESQKNQRPA